MPIEIKRQLILTLKSGQLDYLSDNKTKNVVNQVYSYMAELGLQYGVLSTYDNHWFLFRPKDNPTELQISPALQRNSTSPPVLKAYAYLVHVAMDDSESSHPNIIPNLIRRIGLEKEQSSPKHSIPACK
ncbi:hypothetical protein C2G38_2195271 [Gigaspora rosea]|uniref:Uncharacterized protein n=1 Tax=Gigaspora rosea TaxID=44941 RepID=A0A397UXC2_9GLOM|nr:hypothetical protein C2G38_2195271 [Gigaspora rosea]